MSNFERVYTGSTWENRVGYCQALQAGNFIAVTGTAPIDSHGFVYSTGNAKKQTLRCLELIEAALTKFGAGREDIFRTRLYVTDIDRFDEYGEAHREFFRQHRPTTAMVEVKRLIQPGMLIEIEADAYID
jgi:isochorismate pyruvate lyase